MLKATPDRPDCFHRPKLTESGFTLHLDVYECNSSIIANVGVLLAVGVPIKELQAAVPYYAVLYHGMAILGGMSPSAKTNGRRPADVRTQLGSMAVLG